MLPDHQPARVVVVAGPSGSGKTVLCRRLSADRGWPVVNLDDFYKDGDDPTLPRVELPGGEPVVDWDSAESWSCPAALEALTTLCGVGEVDVPVYDIRPTPGSAAGSWRSEPRRTCSSRGSSPTGWWLRAGSVGCWLMPSACTTRGW